MSDKKHIDATFNITNISHDTVYRFDQNILLYQLKIIFKIHLLVEIV